MSEEDTLKEYRRLRFLGMSVFDFVLTLIGTHIIHTISWLYLVSDKNKTFIIYIFSFMVLFALMIMIGVVMHLIFGVKTVMLAYLGLNAMPEIPR
jgi:uncharacterized membrane protein